MRMFSIFYRPRLANNKNAPLSWFIRLYRCNAICWPLEDKVPYGIYLFDRILWILGFIVFLIHNDAEFRYLRFSFDDLDQMLTGVPTYLVLIELHLRAFSLGWRKNNFKQLLNKFYAEIFIERSTNREIVKQIERQLWPIRVFSLFYACALITYVVKGIYNIISNERELLYKMIPPFDHRTHFYIYFPMLMGNIWVALTVASMMFGEGNILGVLVFHLNGRYLMMRQSFNDAVDKILKNDSNYNITRDYERVLLETLKENLRLNKFAQEIQDEFSFRIFIMLAFSAMSLCALGFKVYTSPLRNLAYVFWEMGKIQELLAFGGMGSIIIDTTDQLSSMYYESNWESIIVRCPHAAANVKLMKLVNLCIATNRKAFHVTGLNFFNVSLNAALTILRGAGSYFTFLISLR